MYPEEDFFPFVFDASPPPTPHLPQPVPGLQWVKQSLIVNDAMIAVDWKKRGRFGSGRVLLCVYYRAVRLFRSVLLTERL